MSFLKNIRSVESQIASLQKYYHSNVWVTAPSSDGYSYLGVSQFAKRYIVRFNKLNMNYYTKTNFGIANRFYLQAYINETKERKEKEQLNLSERLQWERFQIKKNEPFVTLQTIEFDIQLLAPVDMRVIEYEFDSVLHHNLLSAPYYFKVHVLQPLQLQLLLNEQQYQRSRKMFLL